MKLEAIQKLGCGALIAGAILFAAYSVLFAVLLPMTELRSRLLRAETP